MFMAAHFLERADIEDITIHKAVDLNHGECKGEKDKVKEAFKTMVTNFD